MRPTVLGPILHRCFACGGGCFGTDVLVADDERESLQTIATALMVDEPFDGPYLRKGAGRRCVFLGDDLKCEIHRAYGLQAKPMVCRQYPLVGVHAGVDVRMAVDPGCMHAWQSWPDGPEVEEGTTIARSRGGQPMSWRSEEAALLAALEPNHGGVGRVLHVLSHEDRGDDGLPAGVAGRLIGRVLQMRIGERVALEGTATSIREALAQTSRFWSEREGQPLPAWQLPDASDRWAVEAARRMVFLRLPSETQPTIRTLGMLAGALFCGFAHPDGEGFGPALAAWSRVIRTDAGGLLIPNDAMVRHLLDS